MPDVAIGALIGLGGSILVAVVSYFVARLHIDVQKAEIAHKKEEAQIDRAVKSRESYLIPLRKAVSRWMRTANESVAAATRVTVAAERVVGQDVLTAARALKDDTDHLDEVTKRDQEVHGALEELRGQSNDARLEELIEEAQNAQSEAGVKMAAFVRIFNTSIGSSTCGLETAQKESAAIHAQLRQRLLAVNKRIEQLLTGEPLK